MLDDQSVLSEVVRELAVSMASVDCWSVLRDPALVDMYEERVDGVSATDHWFLVSCIQSVE